MTVGVHAEPATERVHTHINTTIILCVSKLNSWKATVKSCKMLPRWWDEDGGDEILSKCYMIKYSRTLRSARSKIDT